MSGLARAYYSKGMYGEAATACDRAESLGCRFDPSMLKVLGRYWGDRTVGRDTP